MHEKIISTPRSSTINYKSLKIVYITTSEKGPRALACANDEKIQIDRLGLWLTGGCLLYPVSNVGGRSAE